MLQPARKGGESDFDKWLWKGKKKKKRGGDEANPEGFLC